MIQQVMQYGFTPTVMTEIAGLVVFVAEITLMLFLTGVFMAFAMPEASKTIEHEIEDDRRQAERLARRALARERVRSNEDFIMSGK